MILLGLCFVRCDSRQFVNDVLSSKHQMHPKLGKDIAISNALSSTYQLFAKFKKILL